MGGAHPDYRRSTSHVTHPRHNFSIALDGFATGEGESLAAPFGHAGERLNEWMFATRWGREMLGQAGGSCGIDDAFARLHDPGIGAEIMGAGKFGPPGWHEDPDGRARGVPTASPAEALETAREAADGRDVRICGGRRVGRAP